MTWYEEKNENSSIFQSNTLKMCGESTEPVCALKFGIFKILAVSAKILLVFERLAQNNCIMTTALFVGDDT